MSMPRSGRRPSLVREVATRTPVVCGGHESLVHIAALMHREDVSSVAIQRQGRLVGIITERDLVRAIEQGVPMSGTTAADRMTTTPMTVRPNDSLARAAQLMSTMRVRHLPVVEDDRLIGFLSLRDLLE